MSRVVRAAPGSEGPALAALSREVIASPSRHVQLALVHVPGPAHEIERQPYLRLSFNIGPSYEIDARGPQGRQHFDCGRHSLLVIPPDTSVIHHAALPKPAGRPYTPARLATFRLSRDLLADCAIALGLRASQATLEHQVVAGDEVLRPLAQALLADLRAGCPEGAVATESCAAALVTRVLLRQARSGPTATAGALARVREHIEMNLHGPLSLESLAEVAGMSRFHFCRVFRERTGVTPHQYILGRRMEKAKRLLWSRDGTSGPAHGGRSIVEIALACGFGSSSHFAARFKRHTGRTPVQWQSSAPKPD